MFLSVRPEEYDTYITSLLGNKHIMYHNSCYFALIIIGQNSENNDIINFQLQ